MIAKAAQSIPVPEELEEVADQPVVLSPRQLAAIVRQAVQDAAQSTFSAPAPECLLTRQELAARLKCSVATVDRSVRDGCPHVKLGDDRRFRFRDVVRWLEERSKCDQLVGGARMAGRVERN